MRNDRGLDGVPPNLQCGRTSLSSSIEKLIDVFRSPKGVVIVRQRSLELVDATTAQPVKQLALQRDVLSAATDGTVLVIADKARIQFFNNDLTLYSEIDVIEACAASAIVKGGIFVCGPDNDWQRFFYTYDIAARMLIGKSTQSVTYKGIPMRAVPGTSNFITVTTGLSPGDYHLHTINQSGLASYVCESPYHGGFAVSPTYAFDSGAVHLINIDGLFLRIVGTYCNHSMDNDYFLKNGNLGTLAATEHFIAMAGNEKGMLGAIVGDHNAYAQLCNKGICTVQKIDIPSRSVMAACPIALKTERIIATVMDTLNDRLIVGYLDGATYRVEQLAYAP